MMYRFSLAILLLSLGCSQVQGQTRLRFGPELGVTISQLPGRYIFAGGSSSSYRELERKPLLAGPLIGGRAQLEMKNRWLLAAAVRYQVLGDDRSYILESNNDLNVSQSRYRQRFHQIGVPLSAGYRLFRIADVPFTLSAGAQLNWLLQAQYQTEHTSKRQGELVYSDISEPVDLLKGERIRVPIRPFQVQFHTSLSAPLGEKFRLAVHYNVGRMLSSYDDLSGLDIPPWICVVPFGTSFRYEEFSIVAAYLFQARQDGRDMHRGGTVRRTEGKGDHQPCR